MAQLRGGLHVADQARHAALPSPSGRSTARVRTAGRTHLRHSAANARPPRDRLASCRATRCFRTIHGRQVFRTAPQLETWPVIIAHRSARAPIEACAVARPKNKLKPVLRQRPHRRERRTSPISPFSLRGRRRPKHDIAPAAAARGVCALQ